MKQFLRPLLLLCLPVLLVACKEDVLAPEQSDCLQTRQTYNTGGSTEQYYNENKIIELRELQMGTLRSSFTFTYGSDGRISESRHFDADNSRQRLLEYITYNDSGKWVKSTRVNPWGSNTIVEAEYDSQGQILKMTSSTERDGKLTINVTTDYEWVDGNNTVFTSVSPWAKITIRYEFDPERENKLRQEQEKIAFINNTVLHNKNMYRRIVTTSTLLDNSGYTEEQTTDYDYKYNEKGLPIELTSTHSSSATGTAYTTTFEYSCD